MIRYRDKILEDYFIDPETAVITNSKGEVQETKNEKNGYAGFHCMDIHRIQIHTHIGYKKGLVIHHLDGNKMNNSLSNLVYLTRNEHNMIHKKGEKNPMYGKHHSSETRKKMSIAKKGKNHPFYIKKGEKHPLYGKHHSSETRKKMSIAQKGEKHPNYGKKFKWINNGLEQRFVPFDSEIPKGFKRGMLKRY